MTQESFIFVYIVLPLLIFLARIIDVSIGVLRILFATKGLKLLAFVCGFFESLIWLIAVSQIIKRLDNIFCLIAFPLGFAAGTAVGIYFEKKISLGFVMVRVVFQEDAMGTITLLRESGFQVTTIDANGMNGAVEIIFSVIRRKKVKDFIRIVKEKNPAAFYTIEDVRSVNSDYVGARKNFMNKSALRK